MDDAGMQWWAEVGQWQEMQEAEQTERDRLAALAEMQARDGEFIEQLSSTEDQ